MTGREDVLVLDPAFCRMVRFFATRLSPRIYFFFSFDSKKISLLLIGDSLPLSPSDCTAETFFLPLVSYEKKVRKVCGRRDFEEQRSQIHHGHFSVLASQCQQ